MDWTQVFVILGAIAGGFLYLSSKIDKVREDLIKDNQNLRNDLGKEIQKNREEILWMKFRLDPYEQYRHKEEDPKEN